MENSTTVQLDEDLVLILINASTIEKLDTATLKIKEIFPNALSLQAIKNSREPHLNGFRRYVNVFVGDDE